MATDGQITPRRVALWAGAAVLAWCGDAVVTALQYRTMVRQQGAGEPAWGEVLPTNFGSSLLWVPFTVLILWVSFRWPITAAPRNVLAHLLSFACVVVGRAAGVVVLNDLVGWYPVQVPGWRELLLTSLVNNLILFVLVTGFAHAIFFRRAAQEMQARFSAARLAVLTNRLQPHFLFNALNTVAALVHDRPEVAERMIVDLSALLRSAIDRDQAGLVGLGEELELGAAYLKIEEHRFADRLRVEFAVDPAVRDAAIPPFLLQPLLENAIRHGIAARPGPSLLRIRAMRSAGEVQVEVADDGIGLAPGGVPEEGVGLANVRARLAEAFGPAARLTLEPGDRGGTTATVRLPYRPAEAPALVVQR